MHLKERSSRVIHCHERSARCLYNVAHHNVDCTHQSVIWVYDFYPTHFTERFSLVSSRSSKIIQFANYLFIQMYYIQISLEQSKEVNRYLETRRAAREVLQRQVFTQRMIFCTESKNYSSLSCCLHWTQVLNLLKLFSRVAEFIIIRQERWWWSGRSVFSSLLMDDHLWQNCWAGSSHSSGCAGSWWPPVNAKLCERKLSGCATGFSPRGGQLWILDGDFLGSAKWRGVLNNEKEWSHPL